MRPVRYRHLMSLVAPLVAAAPLPSQGGLSTRTDTATADSAPPATPATPNPLASFKFSGYAEASYAYSSGAVENMIVGHLYDRYSDQFTVNALKVVIDRPVATDQWDAGVRADLVIGQNAAVLQSSGLTLGDGADVTQLFVTLNVPTGSGNGLQLKAGKLVSLMGMEVIETVANPNWSVGNQFIYVENFTSTGLGVDYRFSQQAELQLRISNGWDRVATGSRNRDVMGRLGLYPAAGTSIGVIGYIGAQQEGSDAKRHGVDLVASRKVGALTLWVQGDYGHEQANPALPDSTRDAEWWAVGAWLSYDPGSAIGAALRADYLVDPQGARTSTAFGLPPGGVHHELWSATGTLNIRTWPNVLLRSEVRYDHSSLTPFGGAPGQLSYSVSMAYLQ